HPQLVAAQPEVPGTDAREAGVPGRARRRPARRRHAPVVAPLPPDRDPREQVNAADPATPLPFRNGPPFRGYFTLARAPRQLRAATMESVIPNHRAMRVVLESPELPLYWFPQRLQRTWQMIAGPRNPPHQVYHIR